MLMAISESCKPRFDMQYLTSSSSMSRWSASTSSTKAPLNWIVHPLVYFRPNAYNQVKKRKDCISHETLLV